MPANLMPDFRFEAERLPTHVGERYSVLLREELLSWREVIDLWVGNEAFVESFIELLAASQYASFRWETPLLNGKTLASDFEFVLLDAPDLAEHAVDTHTFAGQLELLDELSDVAVFENLGGDALLVVPAPREQSQHYRDLASFSRGAPLQQQRGLWRQVGMAVKQRLGLQPLWLNTAGGGVAWLHVRLDQRPKYYVYNPYCEMSGGARVDS